MAHDLFRLRADVGQHDRDLLTGLGLDGGQAVLHVVAGRDFHGTRSRGGGRRGGGRGVLLAAAGSDKGDERGGAEEAEVQVHGAATIRQPAPGCNRQATFRWRA